MIRRKMQYALVSQSWNTFASEFLYEFVWISNAVEAEKLARTLSSSAPQCRGALYGTYIRRLHIQTSMLNRCNPAHLRTILDYSSRLVVYSDHRSVRRNLLEEKHNPSSSPAQLFSTLARPNNSLRRLSWTNYDDFSFHVHMSPALDTIAMNLEFLELSLSTTDLHSLTQAPSSPNHPLTALSLPSLKTLKVTLDNATFAVLAAWDLPLLQNLSVLSADFSYAGPGFSQFFLVHGPKVTQLEFGHSSSSIEEHYLTESPANSNRHHSIPLAAWCPNLREFICSADAEWNWENPDWIAPHVLLPTHPALEFIGIRDLDKRLLDDLGLARGRDLDDDSPLFMLLQQIGSLLREEAFPSLRYIRDLSQGSDIMRRCRPQGRMLRFWAKVVERCSQRGVWLEDCLGINVTKRNLLRYGAEDVEVSCN